MSSKPRTQTSESSVPYEPFVFENLGAGSGTLQNGAVSADFEKKLYEKGLAEGEARARVTLEKTLTETRGEVTEALRHFASQRETYFQRVESEIVQLSLSIARKILHREAQMDPLLLTGIVRVALDSLNEGTQVRLRTNPQEVASWREEFSQPHGPGPVPELIGDASLRPGTCVLETDVGSTQISLETQLKEIEQGFLDLLGQRPRVNE